MRRQLSWQLGIWTRKFKVIKFGKFSHSINCWNFLFTYDKRVRINKRNSVVLYPIFIHSTYPGTENLKYHSLKKLPLHSMLIFLVHLIKEWGDFQNISVVFYPMFIHPWKLTRLFRFRIIYCRTKSLIINDIIYNSWSDNCPCLNIT